MRIVTGFHAIEEELRALEKIQNNKKAAETFEIRYAKPGPRVKKILASAAALSVTCEETSEKDLNTLVENLSVTARDHRGILLIMKNAEQKAPLRLEEAISNIRNKENAVVLVLDSITDPHNVGAIIRSADQFAVDLVIVPENRAASDFEVISRTSAGASSWVSIVLATNLVRAVEQLKEAGFWIYGADAGGDSIHTAIIDKKAVLVMGSEGSGISRLLKAKCDAIISIPTHGKLDSLNVSVAAGVLLYELRKKNPLSATST